MKKIIVSLLCMVSGLLFSQNTIELNVVQIIDRDTKMPVEMAFVGCKNLEVFAKTDSKGWADLSKMINAERIEIRAFNYVPMFFSYKEIQESHFVIEMEPTILEIETMVVSATRWEQSTQDIPNKISVISAKEVAFQNPQTAADMLSSSGEVFVQKSQQGGGSPMIRGFSSNRLLYTIDGTRMNNAIFRGGNIQNVISLDPLSIEGTEVFFGSGSVVYGSDAIGAVMSFKTLTPIFSKNDITITSGKALTRYSNANKEKTFHFNANVGWRKWAFASSVTSSDFDDLRMGKFGPTDYLRKFYMQRLDTNDIIVENENPMVQKPTAYSQINILEKIRFSPNKNWNLQYAFHYSETSSYSRYDRLVELESNGTPHFAVWNYGPQKWMMNQLTIDHLRKNTFYNFMNIRIAHQQFEESRIDRDFNGSNRFRLRTQRENVNAYSVNIDFEKEYGRHKLFYGLESVLNVVHSKGSAYHIISGADIAVADRYPQSTWNSNAVFLNYQWHLNEKIMLQAGARFNHYIVKSDFTRNLNFYPFDFTEISISNSAVTSSLGVSITPNSNWRITSNISTGFRAPNVDDIGKLFDISENEVAVPNKNLKAEYAYTGEFNVAKVIGKRLKIDVSGFYTLLENAMVRRSFLVNGNDSIFFDGNWSKVYALQNAAFASVYGGNIGIELKITKEFSLSSRYNYQVGIEEMENGLLSPSRHAAPAFGLTRLTFQTEKIRLQVYVNYSARVNFNQLNPEEQQKTFLYAKDAQGNPNSPSWYTLNLKAMYSINETFKINAGIENITDQRYRPYSSGLVGAGRNVSISLGANF